MEIANDFIAAVETLLETSEHQSGCPNAGEGTSVTSCACGFGDAAHRVSLLLIKAKAHQAVDNASVF